MVARGCWIDRLRRLVLHLSVRQRAGERIALANVLMRENQTAKPTGWGLCTLVPFPERPGALAGAEGRLPPWEKPPQPPLARLRLPSPTARRPHQRADWRAKLPTRLLARPPPDPTALFLAPGPEPAPRVKPQAVETGFPVVHPSRLRRVLRPPDAGPLLPRPFPGVRGVCRRAVRPEDSIGMALDLISRRRG
jgi:hypothetical protein